MVLLRPWRAILAAIGACLLGACTALPPAAEQPKSESSALGRPERTALGRSVAARASGHGGLSGFRFLTSGAEGFFTRMQLLKSAQRAADIQYFLFEDGDTGKLITDAMREAADRGVRIRLLVDDADFARRGDLITELDRHPNVEVRIFNPFSYRGKNSVMHGLEFLFSGSRLDYRMHNKLFVADNSVAIVGGRNMGDRYFLAKAQAEFEDYDVFVAGPVVRELSAGFDAYWRSRLAVPLRALAPPSPDTASAKAKAAEGGQEDGRPDPVAYAKRAASGEPLAGILAGRLPLVWAPATMICDDPEGKLDHHGRPSGTPTERAIRAAAASARSEVLIVSPYFIPGREGMELLMDLRARGVRVNVLTNSMESMDGVGELMAFAAYAPYRPRLLKAGVGLYELLPLRSEPTEPNSKVEGQFALHAKAFVFDGRRVLVGSTNFDPRSMYLNTEIGLMIDSPELARQITERYQAMMHGPRSYEVALKEDGRLAWRTRRDGRRIEYDEEPARDEEQRAKIAILSKLPLDHEL
ncbi:MAG TPA: phospholipase D family protein [Burkholderiales bacterium]|nr:phospholipase D family protein [Burkholderiales bacterium]